MSALAPTASKILQHRDWSPSAPQPDSCTAAIRGRFASQHRWLLLLRSEGNVNRVIAKHPGRVSRMAEEAVFRRDPLHLADARHPGRLIKHKSSGVIV